MRLFTSTIPTLAVSCCTFGQAYTINTFAVLGLLAVGAAAAAAPPPAAAATPINQCGAISTSGSYVLAADLSYNSGDCLDIEAFGANVSNVSIDCAGHSITGTGNAQIGIYAYLALNLTVANCVISTTWNNSSIKAEQSQNVSITNITANTALNALSSSNVQITGCTVNNPTAVPAGQIFIGLEVAYSQNVTVTNSKFAGNVAVGFSSGVLFANNEVIGFYTQNQTSGATIAWNSFRYSGVVSGVVNSEGSCVDSADGSNNFISYNTIDGGWDGTPAQADSGTQWAQWGIFENNESGDLMEGNTVQNTSDTGVFLNGPAAGNVIDGNTIANTGIGIFVYGYGQVSDNVFSRNSISNAEYMIRSFPFTNTQTPYVFERNQFSRNTFGPRSTFDPLVLRGPGTRVASRTPRHG